MTVTCAQRPLVYNYQSIFLAELLKWKGAITGGSGRVPKNGKNMPKITNIGTFLQF